MTNTTAVLYSHDGYHTDGPKLLGRQSAGESFLKGLVRHGSADCLYCCAEKQDDFKEFCDTISPWLDSPKRVRWIPLDRPQFLAEPGMIYRPDPGLGQLAWSRRFLDQRAYSVCGVTHTIATKTAMEGIGDLLIAPLQPWDALICTSETVKTTVDHYFNTWGEYLARRFRAPAIPRPELKLPVIPLGVDVDAFPQGEAAIASRQQWRQTLGMAPEDIVVLFVGRLIFSAKAHPVPMYMALEKAAKATGAKVHLIQAGWFEDKREEPNFREGARVFCPSVNCIFLDGRKPEIRRNIWSAADIFISLADNIQETFGLTPIEAMANGLPVIVSDWNGYKETVRDGVDGFRVKTIAPESGAGLDLALLYCSDAVNWPTYIGHSSMSTAVDVDAAAIALQRLIIDQELRQRLGNNGRERAKTVYDWRVIIKAYEELWQELAAIRANAIESMALIPPAPPAPLCDDPFRVLEHYPTKNLSDEMLLSLGPMATADHLAQIRRIWVTRFGDDRRLSKDIQDQILEVISQAGVITIGEIKQKFSQSPRETGILSRTLVYLLKFHVLVVV